MLLSAKPFIAILYVILNCRPLLLPILVLLLHINQSLASQPFSHDSPRHHTSSFVNPCHFDRHQSVKDVPACIDAVKRKAADHNKWWFGQTWEKTCMTSKHSHSLHCYNPPSLQPYLSLGSRLFHVVTFDDYYLHNLTVFPEVTFRSPDDLTYEGCDHLEVVPKHLYVHASPFMVPIKPWHLQIMPNISWVGRDPAKYYTVLVVDVGFGKLQYAAYNFPAKTSTKLSYVGPDNFRLSTNPSAVLVFQQSGLLPGLNLLVTSPDADDVFNLSSFIRDNDFRQQMVGLSWIKVSTDASAMEKWKTRLGMNNCHELLIQKQLADPQLPFLTHKDYRGVPMWLRATFQTTSLKASVCCESFDFPSSTESLDPLGDKVIKSVYTRQPPQLSISPSSSHYSPPFDYKRRSRDFDRPLLKLKYLFLMLTKNPSDEQLGNPHRPLIHWLIANIPFDSLQQNFPTDSGRGKIFIDYMAPMPRSEDPEQVFLLLFEQQGDISYFNASSLTVSSGHRSLHGYENRSQFNIEELIARYSLRLKAMTWFNSTKSDFLIRYEDVRWGRAAEYDVCRAVAGYQRGGCSNSISDSEAESKSKMTQRSLIRTSSSAITNGTEPSLDNSCSSFKFVVSLIIISVSLNA